MAGFEFDQITNFENENKYQKFICFLQSLSKNESVNDFERHKRIISSNQNLIGISMKNIRDVAGFISKNCAESFLAISKNKKPSECFYEETLIEGLVIAKTKNLDEQIEMLKEWVKKIDNWATCDSVVTTLKLLNKSKDKMKYFDEFIDLSFSNQEFVSRFGIVTLMSVYLDRKNINKILEIIKEINHDGYYVKMAQAWLVAEAFLVDEKAVYKLLEEKILDAFVQNKSISKCRDSFRIYKEDKEKLKMLRM